MSFQWLRELTFVVTWDEPLNWHLHFYCQTCLTPLSHLPGWCRRQEPSHYFLSNDLSASGCVRCLLVLDVNRLRFGMSSQHRTLSTVSGIVAICCTVPR